QQAMVAGAERLAAIAAVEAVEKKRGRLSAARGLRDIQDMEAEIEAYGQRLTEAEKEAAEPRRQAHAAGARLRLLLDPGIAEQRDGIRREMAIAGAAGAERDQARSALKALVDERVAVQRRDAKLEVNIAAAEAGLVRLQADGVVRPGETVAAAVVRLGMEC